jgi:hypothetical protein
MMSFFGKLFRRETTDARSVGGTVILQGNGDFDFEVVGEASYQDALSEICGGETEGGHEHSCAAGLICDDKNAFDPNAVAVTINGYIVGYLARPAALEYRRQIAGLNIQSSTVGCRAVIRGGWDRGKRDRGNFGVWLDLARPLRVEARG